MKYLKKFSNHTDYAAYMADSPYLPNVSYCVAQDEVHFTPEPPHDYSDDYFTIEAVTAGTVGLRANSTRYNVTYYSVDDGVTWSQLPSPYNTYHYVDLSAGEKMLLKSTHVDNNQIVIVEDSTAHINAYGNVMSLIYGDNFANQTSIQFVSPFRALFKNTKLLSCENLVLPATTLSAGCYAEMFQGCTSITKAPELPALTLTQSCYPSMFDGCTSLNYVKMMATDVTAEDCIYHWIRNVSPTGTFVKNASAMWTEADVIPSGWTVETE